jgi:hypothetical protein
VAAGLSLSFLAAGEKTDVVVLTNGDHITGEIKSLSYGKLEFKTDDLSTVQIEWDKIGAITSASSFTVELQDGSEYLGNLDISPEEGKVRVLAQGGPVDVRFLDIIRMAPIKAGFWERMDGSLSLGASYTHSSKIGQLNLAADATSRTVTHEVALYLSSILSRQPDAPSTERDDLQGAYIHFLRNRWLVGSGLVLQRNKELGIDLRAVASVAVGRHAVQTHRSELTCLGGFAVNEEFVAGGGSSGASVEGLLSSKYTFFRYDHPETNVTISLTVYPGITEWGRLRFDFNSNLRREIIKDFFISFSTYDSFDNRPLIESSQRNDFGVVTSIGWSY